MNVYMKRIVAKRTVPITWSQLLVVLVFELYVLRYSENAQMPMTPIVLENPLNELIWV